MREEPLARTSSLSPGVISRQDSSPQRHRRAAVGTTRGKKKVRMEVKETAAWGQRLNQQCMPDPVPSLNDEGCELSGVDTWEDNDALSMTDVFKMTEVSLNATVIAISQARVSLTLLLFIH